VRQAPAKMMKRWVRRRLGRRDGPAANVGTGDAEGRRSKAEGNPFLTFCLPLLPLMKCLLRPAHGGRGKAPHTRNHAHPHRRSEGPRHRPRGGQGQSATAASRSSRGPTRTPCWAAPTPTPRPVGRSARRTDGNFTPPGGGRVPFRGEILHTERVPSGLPIRPPFRRTVLQPVPSGSIFCSPS